MGSWIDDEETSTIPESVETLRYAGVGCEGSASPGMTVAEMEPDCEERESRSRSLKVPVMGLEIVWRVVLREVQVGRSIGW